MIRETELGRYAARVGSYALLVHDQRGVTPSKALCCAMRDTILALWQVCQETTPMDPPSTLQVWSRQEDARDVEYVRDGLSVVAVVLTEAGWTYVGGLATVLGVAL